MTTHWLRRRVFHLKESVVWRQQSNEKRSRNLGKITWMFGSRLLATSGCWFLWDFSFYGNKGEAHCLASGCVSPAHGSAVSKRPYSLAGLPCSMM